MKNKMNVFFRATKHKCNTNETSLIFLNLSLMSKDGVEKKEKSSKITFSGGKSIEVSDPKEYLDSAIDNSKSLHTWLNLYLYNSNDNYISGELIDSSKISRIWKPYRE